MVFIIFDKVTFVECEVFEFEDEMLRIYNSLPDDIRKNTSMIGIPIDVYNSFSRAEISNLIKELMSST